MGTAEEYREPALPELPGADLKEAPAGALALAQELVREFIQDDVPGLSAEVAYHAVFAIPALLVVFVSLSAVINNVLDYDLGDRMLEMIDESAPDSTRELLRDLVTNAVEQVGGEVASIGLATSMVVAIWAGSNGVGALIKAFNRAYDAVELRPFHRKKALASLLTIVLGLVANLSFALWVFGGQIGGWLASEFAMGETFDWGWNLSRLPGGAVVMVMSLGLLYYYGPTMKQEFRWVLPGALFATAAWGLLVAGFSLYLTIASPGSAYGALSSVIVFLFFLYLTALILIAGAELNAALARRHDARYRLAMGYASRAEPVAPLRPAAAMGREPAPASAGALAVGAATVLGIVVASLLKSRE